MGILGGKFKDQDDDGGGGDAVTLPLDDVVCSTCGRDLAPWMTSCPDDGGAPMARSESMTAGVPDVPAHLLEGLDDADLDGDDPDADGANAVGPDADGANADGPDADHPDAETGPAARPHDPSPRDPDTGT